MIHPQKIAASLILAMVWMPVAFSSTEGSEAGVWLARMATALHEQNYEGVFTYVRGGKFNTMKIVHKFEGGKELERLLQLNGEKLEILRINDDLVCHHEKSDQIDTNIFKYKILTDGSQCKNPERDCLGIQRSDNEPLFELRNGVIRFNSRVIYRVNSGFSG